MHECVVYFKPAYLVLKDIIETQATWSLRFEASEPTRVRATEAQPMRLDSRTKWSRRPCCLCGFRFSALPRRPTSRRGPRRSCAEAKPIGTVESLMRRVLLEALPEVDQARRRPRRTAAPQPALAPRQRRIRDPESGTLGDYPLYLGQITPVQV